MPLMEPFLLKEVFDRLTEHKADAFTFTNQGEPEPLCTIYTATGLQKVMTVLREGRLKKFSMKFVLDHLDLFSIPVSEAHQNYFQNCNAHADLNGL